MNLESQVITLQQAKRLKELGVKQESYFWWIGRETEKFKHEALRLRYSETRTEPKTTWQLLGLQGGYQRETYSAFTCAELGEMLPPITEHLERFANWRWNGFQQGSDYVKLEGYFSTEAEARGAMLIHLIENKLITVEQINPKA